MVRFGESFELNKIPEWYNQYFKYMLLNKMTESYKDQTKQDQLVKLRGYYVFLQNQKKMVRIDTDLKSDDASKKDIEMN